MSRPDGSQIHDRTTPGAPRPRRMLIGTNPGGKNVTVARTVVFTPPCGVCGLPLLPGEECKRCAGAKWGGLQ